MAKYRKQLRRVIKHKYRKQLRRVIKQMKKTDRQGILDAVKALTKLPTELEAFREYCIHTIEKIEEENAQHETSGE
jgi:hypothetical protein